MWNESWKSNKSLAELFSTLSLSFSLRFRSAMTWSWPTKGLRFTTPALLFIPTPHFGEQFEFEFEPCSITDAKSLFVSHHISKLGFTLLEGGEEWEFPNEMMWDEEDDAVMEAVQELFQLPVALGCFAGLSSATSHGCRVCTEWSRSVWDV